MMQRVICKCGDSANCPLWHAGDYLRWSGGFGQFLAILRLVSVGENGLGHFEGRVIGRVKNKWDRVGRVVRYQCYIELVRRGTNPPTGKMITKLKQLEAK